MIEDQLSTKEVSVKKVLLFMVAVSVLSVSCPSQSYADPNDGTNPECLSTICGQ